MSKPLLTLGSFSFDGFESPERIVLKSKQRLAVHHLGSGLSTADSLGEDCEIASFRGIFTGANSSARIRSIEYLRSQGQPISLVWGSKTLLVIIQSFELNYLSNQWVPYKLTCVVTGSSSSQGVISPDPISSSPDAQVGDILGLLQSTSVSATPPQITALVELAALNYDIAPPATLQQAQQLANMVTSQVTTLDLVVQNGATSISTSLVEIANGLISFIAIVGQEASLILSGNRLTEVIISAQNVNQQ